MTSKLKRVVLSNGLRVIFLPQSQSLAVTFLVLVEAGSEYETKEESGISHFLEHLVFKGTKRRPKSELISFELDSLGAEYNAFTGQEMTGYYAKAQYQKFSQILDLISDMYLNPIFPPEEIEKERGVIIEEINMYEDNPMRKVHEVYSELLYGDQPAGWSTAGTKETVGRITRDQIIAYRENRYKAPLTTVIVAGKFNEKKALAEIKNIFGVLKRGKAYLKPKVQENQKTPAVKIEFKESAQSHLVLGFRTFSVFDPRRRAAQMLSHVLGGGMSSRLFRKIREDLGAAYYVHAHADFGLDHGSFDISMGVENGKLQLAIAETLKEIRRIIEEPILEEEFKRVKDHLIGSLLLGIETSDEAASFYGSQEILTKKIVPIEKIVDQFARLKARDLQRVAREIFVSSGLNLAIIGPQRDEASLRAKLRI